MVEVGSFKIPHFRVRTECSVSELHLHEMVGLTRFELAILLRARQVLFLISFRAIKVALREGIEPPTTWLTAKRSTN